MSAASREGASPPPATAALAGEAAAADQAVETTEHKENGDDVTAKKDAQEGTEVNEGEEAKATEAEPAADDMDQSADQPAAEGAAMDVDEGPSGVTNGTPASTKKSKRKSSSGVPEHRSRKVNRKKSQVLTHIHAKPGEHYLARLKGHPPWPSVIADEDMLPQALLATRGVSAMRADGTYREDYAEGGKRVNERTFPVMFLGTYEFAWIVNTDLMDFDFGTAEDQKRPRKPGLDEAFKTAAEKHDLAWYKALLREHQKEIQDKQKAAVEGKKSKSKRKSKAPADEDEDVDMEDADAAEPEDEEDTDEKPRSRKRKKDPESDGEETKKPAKTPKRKESTKTTTPRLKLTNPKTPNGTEGTKSATKSASTAKGSKSKASSSKKSAKTKEKEKEVSEESDTPAKAMEQEISPAEKRERRHKELLFLRHKLQRGLLLRDQPPLEEEMQAMSDFIAKLETYNDLDANIVRETKMNKVLKGIIKLASIPKEEEFKFRQRSHDLLQKWNQSMTKEPETPTVPTAGAKDEADVNGDAKAEKSTDEKATDEKAELAADEDKAEKKETNGEKATEEPAKEDEGEASKADGDADKAEPEAQPEPEPEANKEEATKITAPAAEPKADEPAKEATDAAVETSEAVEAAA